MNECAERKKGNEKKNGLNLDTHIKRRNCSQNAIKIAHCTKRTLLKENAILSGAVQNKGSISCVYVCFFFLPQCHSVLIPKNS